MQASLMGLASFFSSASQQAIIASSVDAPSSSSLAVSSSTTGSGATAPATIRAGRSPPQRRAKLMRGKSMVARMAYL